MSDWKSAVQLLSKYILEDLETELFNNGFGDLQFIQESIYHLYLSAYCSLQKAYVGLTIQKQTIQKAELMQREWQTIYGKNAKNIQEKGQQSFVNNVYSVLYFAKINCCVLVHELFVCTLEQEMQTLRQENQWYTKEQMCRIIIQICFGLTEIHQQKLIHCDIKPENIVKSLDGNYKLNYLGFSKLFQKYNEYKIYYLAFSQKYISPEISYKIEKDQSVKITHKTDAYSLCLVILEVLNYNLTKLNALNILLNEFHPSQTSSNSSLEEFQKSFEFEEVYELFCKKFFRQDPLERCDSYEILFNLLPLLPLSINNLNLLQDELNKKNIDNLYQNINNQSYSLSNKLYNSLIQIQLNQQQNIQPVDQIHVYQNSAQYHLEAGQLNESLNLYFKALQVATEQQLGESQESALIQEQISLVYNRLGNYELALKYAQNSLNLIQNIYQNSNNELVAQCLHRMSTSYQVLNNPEQSFYYAEKALKMRQIIYGKILSEQLADSLDQMSNSYYLKNDFDSALQFCNQSLEIIQQIHPSPHPKIQLSLNNLACIYYQQQNFESSVKYFYLGLEIAMQLYGLQHPIVQKVTENLGYVLNLLNNQKLVEKYKNDLIKLQNNFSLVNF